MIATRQQVVVLADHNGGRVPWYHERTRGSCRRRRTPSTPDLLSKAGNWPTSCGPNRGDVTGSMFLMNHWSPPTPPPVPDPDASAAVNAKSVILGCIRPCEQARGRLPTVIAADQVTYGGLIGAVRTLNAGG